ncbi:hypothetical protein DHW03_01695 [Pedobacter yonginense]|uniref:Uncharacterized protein n=1 Tax=Pedobacter yonginense TaxID=651869 RepID=A0A317ENZ8_9SPHI|nr:hypothetical protein [Pedobacter yonginense]PWS28590.1 hypothetical protein DHW03_01695 [Pedobacter yonginense]
MATLSVMAFSALNCSSQSGCFVPVAGSAGRSSVDKIYTDPQPGEPAGKFYTTANSYMLTCAPGAYSYAANVVDASPATGCWVDYKNDGSPTQFPNNYYQNGKVVNFTIQYCPIDNLLPYAFVLFAGMGVFLLRAKNNFG